MTRALIRHLRLLVRNEAGIALPTALLATTASLALGGAAVMSSVDVQSGSKRDGGSKSAIAAADAGANVAMQRLNRYGDALSSEKPCVNLNAGQLVAGEALPDEPAWCAPIKGEVGGATYSYRVSALGNPCGAQDVCIVSTGTASEVSRRIQLSLDESGLQIGSGQEDLDTQKVNLTSLRDASIAELEKLKEELEDATEANEHGGALAGLVGREEITMSGNVTTGTGVGVATNGWLTTSGNVSICGDIQTGIGKPWTPTTTMKQCKGYLNTQGTISLLSVSSFIPSDIATNNSNARLTKCTGGLPVGCQKDTYNGSWSSTKPFDPQTRSISLSGNGVLTIGGGDYWLCSLTLSGNQELVMADGAHSRFFFDTPQNCGGTSSQINISGNSKITSTGYQGKPGHFAMPGFYLLGSTSGTTSQASISGNSSGNEFILYGPDTYVTISGNASKGILVGRKVTLSGNAKIERDNGFETPSELLPPGDGSLIKTIEQLIIDKQQEIDKFDLDITTIDSALANGSSARAFFAQSYVECSGGAATAGEAPDAGC